MSEVVSHNINDSTRNHILTVVDELLPPHTYYETNVNEDPSHFYFSTSSLHDIIPEFSEDLDYDLRRAIDRNNGMSIPQIPFRPNTEISQPFTQRYSEIKVEPKDSMEGLTALKLSYNGLIKVDDKYFEFSHNKPKISVYAIDRNSEDILDHRQTIIYTYVPHLGTATTDKDRQYARSEHEYIEEVDTPIVKIENLLHIMQRKVRWARIH
jgi:hypothetical protein